ncbi:MAG: hypothetical protein FJY11_06550, partial [Bacteroidetes bacterium]|nr:hypothetical protein [Bacteroidota bacterium]
MRSLLVITACFFSGAFYAIGQNHTTGIRLFESGKYDEAFTQFSSVKKGSGEYAESRYYMGLISLRRRESDKAEEYTEQAIDANGNVAKYHLSMINILGQQASGASTLKQASIATRIKSHMESAARLDPKDINSRTMLIQFYVRAPKMMGGDIDKARKTADEISKINSAEGYRAHATIDQAEEKWAEAERNFQRAMNLAPDSLKHYTTLASFYQSRSNPEQAFSVYDRAMAKFPANRNLLMQAGRLASSSGPKYHDRGIR